MLGDDTYTTEAANKHFAVYYNNYCWQLIEKKGKTEAECDEMINAAHASLRHWTERPDCKTLNLQRGEYLIAMAYINADRKEPALHHAERCLQLTITNADESKDFDFAHAAAIMAGAWQLNGNQIEAEKHLNEAKQLGEKISGARDKQIFMGDLLLLGLQ